ncbi:YopX family protein [Paenibacillus sp. FSL M7-0896]|uniref:YopX family protein n=1 Tax=Paenibacillus sp. FSL M7-0896 TaxID=2921610 RepID=UPI0030D9D9F0
MREIKFRAWDTETKEMSYDFLNKHWLRVCIESPYVELMQYTGLQDKNGREIYAGDLVQNERFTALIVWSDHHQWGYKIVRGETLLINAEFPLWHEDVPTRYTCSNLEVIGNIYDSPELLEV